MREEKVSFYSEGELVSGILRLPDAGVPGPYPVIVQGPGWLQVKEAKRNLPYHQAFVSAGFAAFVIDFRGFGESGGSRADLLPHRWIEDLVNAVTYLTTRPEIDPYAIGTFGSGSTGGGNAIMLPAADPRVRVAVSQNPISDGADWLRRMRREYEWYEFLARLREDAVSRVTTGKGEMVHPRVGIMVTTPERQARDKRENTQSSHLNEVSLRSAEAIMAYRPIDVIGSVRALLVVGVEDDPVTPTDHSIDLYEAAPAPKKLIMQGRTTHYEAYEQYAAEVIPQMVDWFRRHFAHGPITVREASPDEITEATGG
jgi:dipeptidyl aminopeptidase/acylaminoacyl peptidase